MDRHPRSSQYCQVRTLGSIDDYIQPGTGSGHPPPGICTVSYAPDARMANRRRNGGLKHGLCRGSTRRPNLALVP